MKELERVIYHQKYISIKYMVDNQIEEYEVKPYKIIFMKENFYLAAEIDNNDFTFTLYRISKIKEIKDSNKTFCKNLEIEDFIKFMQTPFARYQKGFRTHLIKIVLEVHQDKAYFFKSKKFLNSQTILEEKENGSLTVSYEVTQEIEIEELVKKWLPYVRVIEPLSLKNKLEDELKAYLLS